LKPQALFDVKSMSEGRRRAFLQRKTGVLMKKLPEIWIKRVSGVSIYLILVTMLSGCLVQVTNPVESTTPAALTPAATNEDLPLSLADDAGDAPILITPAALQTAQALSTTNSTPTVSTTQTLLTSVCGRSDAQTILILGIDENAQADAIRLARIDFSKAEVNIVAIPRDFFVSVVGFEEYGIQKGRINATFGYGEYFLGTGHGAEALAENLAYNFGVDVDHQFVLHFAEIAEYIDAVGGVAVVLDKPASDSINYFPAGINQMDGERAVAFMRIREYDSDFKRIDRQTMVLKALLDKVRGGLSAGKVFNLLIALVKDNSTQSDLTLGDLQSFYCLSQRIDEDTIHVPVIPAEMFHTYITPNGGWVLVPHEDVPDFIHESLFP